MATRLLLVWLVAAISVGWARAASYSLPLTRRLVTPSEVQRLRRLGVRTRALQDEVALYGNFRNLAYYYADVFIGSQHQKFTVIADTGSGLLAVPCFDCTTCGRHMNPFYNYESSTTAHVVLCSESPGCSCNNGKCGYSQSYAEGSTIRGVLVVDNVMVGDDETSVASHDAFTVEGFRFGCQQYETRLFYEQKADGIMGLNHDARSMFTSLWTQGKLDENVLGLCLSLDGGAMTLGTVDQRLHLGPVQWSAMSLSSFYQVGVSSFVLGDASGASFAASTSLPVTGFASRTIIDSGTTFTYVPTATYRALNTAVEAFCNQPGKCRGTRQAGESICYSLQHVEDISTFPSIRIVIAGGSANFLMRPEHIFLNMTWRASVYCSSIYDNGAGGGVIGGSSLMGHNVILDVQNKRVGIAPSACTYQGQIVGPTPASEPPLSASSSPAAPASSSPAASLAVASASAVNGTEVSDDGYISVSSISTVAAVGIGVAAALGVLCGLAICCLNCRLKIGSMHVQIGGDGDEGVVVSTGRAAAPTRYAPRLMLPRREPTVTYVRVQAQTANAVERLMEG